MDFHPEDLFRLDKPSQVAALRTLSRAQLRTLLDAFPPKGDVYFFLLVEQVFVASETLVFDNARAALLDERWWRKLTGTDGRVLLLPDEAMHLLLYPRQALDLRSGLLAVFWDDEDRLDLICQYQPGQSVAEREAIPPALRAHVQALDGVNLLPATAGCEKHLLWYAAQPEASTPSETEPPMTQNDEKACTGCGVTGVDLSANNQKCIFCYTGQPRPADSPFQPPKK